MSIRFSLFFLLVFSTTIVSAQHPYQNKNLATKQRVEDLLGRMTQEEKFWQLFMIPGDLDDAKPNQYRNGIFGFQVSAGAKGDAGGQLLSYNTKENAKVLARKINAIQKYFVEESRLGIPIIAFDEALHGLVRDGATAFPQSIAMASTWDTVLISKVGAQIAQETKLRGIRQILSPVVNLASDVRWGRTEETYGEDPTLTTAMGLAFIQQFEKRGIITTPKHFIANVGDGGRDSYPINYSARFLEETHFVPFKKLIQQGGARSIMTAYNSLNGTASSSNNWLLQNKLKKEWGFKGFVISDANAVGGEVVLHNTAKDYAESGKHAINGGLDVIFQTDYEHHKLFIPAFQNHEIDTTRLNDAVRRVLTAKFDLGLFENPYVKEDFDDQKLMQESRKVAKQVALESFVLLKNQNRVLPLSQNIKSVAVFGKDAVEARLGGYAGPGTNKISILEGLKSTDKNIQFQFVEGLDREDNDYSVVPAKYLSHKNQKGLQASYFDNINFVGKPAVEKVDEQLDFHWTLFAPSKELKVDNYSVRWEGKLESPKTGTYQIGLEGNDGYRLFVNNELLIDKTAKQSYHSSLVDFKFEHGKKYAIKIEFLETQGEGKIKLIWNVEEEKPWQKRLDEMMAVSAKSDLNLVVAGINEGEFNDRAGLRLPGHQEELIKALKKNGKLTVVLLVGGSAITMNNWITDADAVMSIWYPGEAGGEAVADILFGKANPSGKSPITFPLDEAQLPLTYLHQPTGRGNDYNNLTGQPLFPFGFGLSYTKFQFSDIQLSKGEINANESVKVSFKVKNVGTMEGTEVAQLYVKDVLSSVAQPLLALKDFQRVSLKPGEEKMLSFDIKPEMLSLLDKDLNQVVEPGDFRIMVGSSSKELWLKADLKVKP